MTKRISATGRAEAQFLYRLGQCELCDQPAVDRHHLDEDETNNSADNIQRLCRRCHLTVDGRIQVLKDNAAKANAQRAANSRTKEPQVCTACGETYTGPRLGICNRCYFRAYYGYNPNNYHGHYNKRNKRAE